MTKYLVTGATGQLGRLTLDALAQKTETSNIAVLVRSKTAQAEFTALGYDARLGDYGNPAQLKASFAGVNRLLLISGSEIGQRAQQHQNVIDAAVASGVGYIAYTSLLQADKNPMALAEEHKATEQALAASGLDVTVLRNGWYTENHTMGLAQIVAMGQQFGAAGAGRFSTASRRDYAEAAAAVLTGEGHGGKTYELGGDGSYSLADFARAAAQVSGKEIAYVDMPEAAFAEALVGAGLPAGFAGILANSDALAAEGWLETQSKDLQGLIGRPTTSLSDSLSAAFAAL